MASTYLTRSLASTNTSWTFSAWVKRSQLNLTNYLISWGNSGTDGTGIGFTADDGYLFYYSESSPDNKYKLTSAKYRDVSAWYHIVCKCDANAITLYVNGEEPTQSWSVGSSANPLDTSTMAIGKWVTSNFYHNGSMAHVHFIDGTAYDASTFGETDATTGIWKPKTAPSVTYGTNGFFLKFENSGAFGTDSSGNANNFTVNGTMTQTIDTPSNVFATLNPLASGVAIGGVAGTFANGNTFFSGASASWCATKGTIAITQGKYYFEAKKVTNANGTGSGAGAVSVGFAELQSNLGNNNPQTDSAIYNSILVVNDNGWTTNFANGTQWSTPQAVNDGDIVGIALDLDGNNYTFYVNGTQVDTGSLGAGYDGNGLTPCLINYGGDTREFYCNFGNGYFGTTAVASAQNPDDGIGIFEYSVPTGYKALCTKSINAQEYD